MVWLLRSLDRAGWTGLERVGRKRTEHREKKGNRAFRGRRRETKPLEPRRGWWGVRGISPCETQNRRKQSSNAGSWRRFGWGSGTGRARPRGGVSGGEGTGATAWTFPG